MLISLNLGDGIGINRQTPNSEKFYEDFLTINGKLYKLDQTRIEFNTADLLSEHTFVSIGERAFPERSCDLKFEPIGIRPTGKDFVFIAVIQ